jgi:hypothetical protein
MKPLGLGGTEGQAGRIQGWRASPSRSQQPRCLLQLQVLQAFLVPPRSMQHVTGVLHQNWLSVSVARASCGEGWRCVHPKVCTPAGPPCCEARPAESDGHSSDQRVLQLLMESKTHQMRECLLNSTVMSINPVPFDFMQQPKPSKANQVAHLHMELRTT